MIVIGITGMPACGKSLFTEVAKGRGYQVFDLSSVLKGMLSREGKGISSTNLSALAKKIRDEEGMDAVARRLYKTIPKKGKIIIAGFRSYPEVEFMRKKFRDMAMVSLITETKRRLAFTLAIKKYDIHNEKDFRSRDKRDLDLGLGRVICLSDYFLFNDVPKGAFLQRSKKLIERIEREHIGNRGKG
jgi:dephospho-CoA kinase